MPKPKTTGEKIRERREELGMTQEELADQIGISKNMLRYYELDQHEAKFFTMTCIADVLDLSLDYLAGRK